MAITKYLSCVLVKDTCYIQDCARVVHAGGLMRHGGIFAVDKNNVTEIGKVIKMMLSTPLKIMSDEEYMKKLNSKELSLMLKVTKTKSYGALAKISKDVAIQFMIKLGLRHLNHYQLLVGSDLSVKNSTPGSLIPRSFAVVGNQSTN